jgi:hypothetical protein
MLMWRDEYGWVHDKTITRVVYPVDKIKQTRIDGQELPDGRIKFVGFENVLTIEELLTKLSSDHYHKYIDGRAYYKVPNAIRCYSEKEFYNDMLQYCMPTHYKDFLVGESYSRKEWEFFINFLKEAGTRLSEIKHSPKIFSTYI